ncbi:MAG: FlxA-like family protein [Bacillus sp. (in: firmicutes)]
MHISSAGSNSYSTNSTTSDSAIKDLEKQKTDIQEEINETSSSTDNTDSKQTKIQQLQQQLQQIELQIQQLKMKNSKAQTNIAEETSLKQQQDTLEISSEASSLFQELQEE